MDRAVYATAKPAASAPAAAEEAKPAPVKTVKGAKNARTAPVEPPVAATAAIPKTTVAAALPKARKDSARTKTVVLPAPAGGTRTVSAALPKDMQPTAAATPVAQAAPAGNVEYHTVARGETVFSIAKRYSVTVTDLQAWNQLDFAAIRVGQQLRVKKP